jgi:flagellar hook-length control protein FliK
LREVTDGSKTAPRALPDGAAGTPRAAAPERPAAGDRAVANHAGSAHVATLAASATARPVEGAASNDDEAGARPFNQAPQSSSDAVANDPAASESGQAFGAGGPVSEPAQRAPAPQLLPASVPPPSREGSAPIAPAVLKSFASAAADDEVVVPQLVRAMHLQVVRGGGAARLQLEPHHLGAVSVALRVENGVVSAMVTAEQAGVRHWIQAHETTLRQALAEQGLVLDELRVEADDEPANGRSGREYDGAPRRRSRRPDTATFELVA